MSIYVVSVWDSGYLKAIWYYDNEKAARKRMKIEEELYGLQNLEDDGNEISVEFHETTVRSEV